MSVPSNSRAGEGKRDGGGGGGGETSLFIPTATEMLLPVPFSSSFPVLRYGIAAEEVGEWQRKKREEEAGKSLMARQIRSLSLSFLLLSLSDLFYGLRDASRGNPDHLSPPLLLPLISLGGGV